ncbi:MAG: hypothetical protein II966_08245 [Lachnospiraceae bacterium]|nr:hypothetical protein [Lachnospiraceae bacterium]
MRIAQSNINMSSARQYRQAGTRSYGLKDSDSFEEIRGSLGNLKEKAGGFSEGKNSTIKYDTDAFGYSKNLEKLKGKNGEDIESDLPAATQFQNMLLKLIMARFSSAGMFGGTTRQAITYEEYEETEFHTDGMAKTEDGRTIDFTIDISMSRSYMEYMNINLVPIQNALCDPLIVNIASGTADIRDQKFFFDIDADGTEDEIPVLGRGSGFLALDRNEDGKINDGSELFGTKSGNGFADLAEYDSDGNGWIDENDAVFDKLKVWCRGSDGEDILMDLKEADIGAIYLGHKETEFTLEGMTGARDGVIRSTGFFLKESGGAGTIQHVDLAVGNKDSNEETFTGVNAVSAGSLTLASFRFESRSEISSSRRLKRADDTKKKAVEKRQEADLIKKKNMEKQTARRLELKYVNEQYERTQSAENFARMHEEHRADMEQYFNDRFERLEKEKEFLEDDILEKLFADTGLYEVI